MAERILVSTEEIQSAITQYNSARDTKMSAIEAMNAAVTALDGTWDGMASEAFFGAFRALYGNLQDSDRVMQDAVTELTNVSNTAQQAEDNLKAANQGLDAGTKFEF